MLIEKQCCTLEQAKRLEELGIVQGVSLFFWDELLKKIVYNSHNKEGYKNAITCFSMFTVSELGVMLPNSIWQNQCNHSLITEKFSKKWHINYVAESETTSWGLNGLDDGYMLPTEAECRAAMLIYLLENKLVTAEDCNKRLSE